MTRSAASTPATPTAAVPWMSSLKLGDLSVVAIQDLESQVLMKVLPLEEALRKDFFHGGDEGVEDLPVRLALKTTAPVAQVVRVAQQIGVVRADVEAHR
jgi:hypothetical protein